MPDIDLMTVQRQSRERSFSDALLAPGQMLQDLAAMNPEIAAFIALARATVPANLPAGKRIRVTGLLRCEVVDV